MPGEKPRAVLQFNEYDFRHRKVLEILRERPRNKTELVVNAILHYMSCPEAAEEFNKSAMKQMIREVSVEGRKRTYELTDAGKKLYDAECDRLRRCIRDADREEENV